MLKIDIFECGSFRVTEDASKDEKCGREDGSCVNGSHIKKPVPPQIMAEFIYRGW